MRIFALLPFLAALSCAEQLPDHVELEPAAENVEIVSDTPNHDTFRMVGEVTAEAAAKDPDAAQAAARNALRNKAAAMGAVLVKIDEDVGEPLLLEDKTRVKLTGRAYKPA